MKSLGAAVRISKGSPPASRTASLTTFAMPSRWLKQIASSDELLTTAIFGLSRSASVRPRAFHCARRTASRGEPGSKLLRSVLMAPIVTPSKLGASVDARARASARRHPRRRRASEQALVLALRARRADHLLRRQRDGSVADSGGLDPGDQEGVRRQRLPARAAERHPVRALLFLPRHPDRGAGRSLEPHERPGARRGNLERYDGALRHGGELHDAVC